MVAAMLMLPNPRREYAQTRNALPVASLNGYVLSRIGFGPDTEFTGVNDLVTIDPSFVDLDNLAHKDSIGVAHRWSRITAIYVSSAQLPQEVRNCIEQHRDYMADGQPVDVGLTKIVGALLKAVEAISPGWRPSSDPLPALERMLGISAPTGPSLPAPDDLGEDEPLVSARSAHQYRLAKMRGASARRFSLEVREAYAHRCAFCGARFGGVRGVRSGLDAAHILAWSKHDLDVVPNGLSLCKLHHWAFDAALLMPVKSGTDYYLEFTELSRAFDPQSMELLGVHGSPIPDAWLPTDQSKRPSQQYLNILYADLAVSFLP
jgi:hypothetical protein